MIDEEAEDAGGAVTKEHGDGAGEPHADEVWGEAIETAATTEKDEGADVATDREEESMPPANKKALAEDEAAAAHVQFGDEQLHEGARGGEGILSRDSRRTPSMSASA